MTAPRPLSLHVPEPGCRPGDTPDFSDFEIPRAGAVRRPAIDEAPEDMRDMAFSVVRVLNKAGEAVGPWAGAAGRRGAAHGPAPHADPAPVRRAHAEGAAPGQDQLLHAASGRGSRVLRLPHGAAGRRHALPHLPAGRSAHRQRLSHDRHDEPDLLQRRRPAEGPPAAGDVLGARPRLLHHLRQPGHAVHPGGGLGDGLGDLQRHEDRRRLDRRRLDLGERLPRRDGPSPPATRRR